MTIRTSSFVRGLGAGYLTTGINIAFTAISVPLALHYLGKDQFGLWSLAQQIVGYLILLDLGVTSAVSRFIADHKDDVNGGDYGRMLLTGGIVFALQGILIVLAGLVFSIFAPAFFAIPAPFAPDFTNVLMLITFISGFSVFCRSLAAPLWAFHRIDFSYLMGSISLILGLAVLWLGFHFNLGIYSLAISGLPGALLTPVMAFCFCKKNGFYPSSKSGLQMPTLPDIRRVFAFGKDAALVALGSQMVNASQIMIISRFVGLDTAATFSVGTKLYSLGQHLVAKVIGTAAPALTELFVRGEVSKFKARFFDVVSITAFSATLFASALVSGNSAVVSIWTSGVIKWDWWADTLLGALLIATSVTRCLTELFVFRGNLKTVRHIYLAEGLLTIVLSIPAVSYFGFAGLLASALFVHLAVTFFSTSRAIVKAGFPAFQIRNLILKSFSIISLLFILQKDHYLEVPWIFFSIFFFAPLGAFLGWHYLLDGTLRAEIIKAFWARKK